MNKYKLNVSFEFIRQGRHCHLHRKFVLLLGKIKEENLHQDFELTLSVNSPRKSNE